jgi:hypothetical protein
MTEEERLRRIKESLEKYKKGGSCYNNLKSVKQSVPSNNNKNNDNKNKIKDNKNKEKSSEKVKVDDNKSNKKTIPSKEDKNSSSKKEILNKKRNRDEKSDKKDSTKKTVEKKKYISDDEDEYDSNSEEDKSYKAGSEESESSSSSSYSSVQKNKSTTKKIHKKVIKKVKKESGSSSTKKTVLKPKGVLVLELLTRWWYALPEWPPENYDVNDKLKENKLRLVKITDWKKEPKFDKDNFEKCLELPGFKYEYLNSDGKVFDFRPEEGKPSYNNLIKLPDIKLHEYLVKAYKAQLEELEKRNSVFEKDLIVNIKQKLDKEERNLALLKK